ncbi:DNA mismatch repair endonuclease MutH [Planctobacterium marinum]|uniref:DNA mismatch repair protein MutH n=1 Tax=Planctobacterium marinum TaxID=1631968 RepID=A0AA48KNI6_9ALTE|nr:DNA mismatch repair protein MutH [Planctobacterium marinum]
MTPPSTPPDTLEELQHRVNAIAGLSLGDLACSANIKVPANFKKEKGWTGQLIELWLGASAGSKPEQDFVNLGIELKTLPITTTGKVLETTYVCYAHLTGNAGLNWQNCNVRNKLQHVLWLPVIGQRNISPAQRQVGTGIFWQPNALQEQRLRHDWEEHMDNIALGNIESLSAKAGDVLQLRPKAADGSVVTDATGVDGQMIKTRPRGFYLRKNFTQEIIDCAFDR